MRGTKEVREWLVAGRQVASRIVARVSTFGAGSEVSTDETASEALCTTWGMHAPANPENERAAENGADIAWHEIIEAVRLVPPRPRAEHGDCDHRGSAADEMNDRGAGKVVEGGVQRREPATAPRPRDGDREGAAADETREKDVACHLGALRHRSRNDRRGCRLEDEVVEERRKRHVVCRLCKPRRDAIRDGVTPSECDD